MPSPAGHWVRRRESDRAPTARCASRQLHASHRGALGIQTAIFAALLLFLPSFPLTAQEAGSIAGRVVDAETSEPVPDVTVRVQSVIGTTSTGRDGRFELGEVPAGPQLLVMEHLAYEERVIAVVVPEGDVYRIGVRLRPSAIQLDSMLVETLTDLDRRRQSTGFSVNEIGRERIDVAAAQGLSMWELLRDEMPQVQVRQQSYGFISCLEYRGATSLSGGCQMMEIFVDGLRVSSPGTVPPNMPLNDIERIEAIGPGEAGVQYGSMGGGGVLLIETRQGPRAQEQRRMSELAAGLDWSGEARPYAWGRAFGSSFLAHAAGLGVGLLAADQCLELERERAALGVRERCSTIASITAGTVVVALPNLAGSYAARWGGETERSRGRFIPAAILGALPSLTGYLFYFEGQAQESAVLSGLGIGLLTIGTPALMTLSDRLFRVLN